MIQVLRPWDLNVVDRFARKLGNDLYGEGNRPFSVGLQDAKGSAAYLARRRAEALRDARLASSRKGKSSARRTGQRRAARAGRS